ncbi:serine hydrolase domain-containing protein, partial [Nocardioides pelophilus]|uniref:serine hydrolase domain-containing protein n=1 Tax=Nocardioides pelophilus TaxID=2172019 RepID=UPI0015FF3517
AFPAAAATVLAAGCSGAGAGGSGTAPVATQRAPEEFVWQSVGPGRAGLDPVALRTIARDARRAGSTCLLVVRDGRIAGEWYWRDGAADAAVAGFSVTKSVTSTLVGIAESEGHLDIDDRASRYVRAWRGTPAAAVTVRDLLSNDSGRTWSRVTDYVGLIMAEDRTSYAVGLGQEKPPGSVWAYNNAAIQTLDEVLRRATGVPTADYAEERLFEPLGMTDTRMTGDASGRSTSTAFGLETTCRDLGRFGLLFSRGGAWEGAQVVPRSWVDEAVGRPSQRLNPDYGLLWWLNHDGSLVPGAPRDVFAAIGFGGQVLLVDPRSETVVVRLGVPGEGDYDVRDAARVVTEAVRRPR